MSPTSKSRLRLTAMMLFGMLIAAGIYLRIHELTTLPFGIDSDQSRVILVGREAWETGKFRVFADESTRFEALSSYVFSLSEKVFGDARVFSLLFSFADLVLLGWLLRRRNTPWEFTLGGVALLAASPFAIFYSHVTGPCVGVSTILLAFFLSRREWARWLWLTVGLFYYSILRLLWMFEVAGGLYRRDWRRAGRAALSVLVLLLLSFLAGDFGSEAQLRGGYNFNLSFTEFSTRAVEGLRLWMGPPSDRMVNVTDDFIIDPVSRSFAWVLGSAPAMGIGFALLFVLALLQFGQDSFANFRARGLRQTLETLEPELKFFLLASLAMMLSPTYSHALFLAPLAVYFVVRAFLPVADRHAGVRFVLLFAMVISSWSGAVQSQRMWDNLKQPGQFDEVFADRVRALFENHIMVDEMRVTYFTPQNYDVARFWARRGGERVAVLPPFDPEIALRSLKLQAQGAEQVVYFDVQKLNFAFLQRPEAKSTLAMQEQIENQLSQNADVTSKEDIKIFGQVVARRYVVRFR